MGDAGRTSWFASVAGAPGRTRLFVFPFAGGIAASFLGWQALLGIAVELHVAQLPGRGPRLFEPPLTDLDELVSRLAEAVARRADRPFVFLGHSLGALLAFEVARALRRTGSAGPRALWLSGAEGPQTRVVQRELHRLSDAALTTALGAFGATPAELLADPEMMELLLPGIRADFTLAERYVYTPEPPLDRVLHKASIGFDASVHEIFSPLIAGGTLVIAPPGLQFDSLGLVRLIRTAGVTTAHFVPTMLRHVLDEPELAACTVLRRVLCGGEALDMALVRRFRSTLPCRLYNGYGPTETSINVAYWDCAEPHEGTIAPIGRPIAGADVEVLGDDLEPVPPGDTGELWVGGVPVGLRYLDGDADTRARFHTTAAGRRYRTGDLVRVAPAGYLEFRGRVDDQVKIRGVRVEPGEVGAVLRRHPAVRDAAVVVATDSGADRWLVGYVVADPRQSPVVSGLGRVPLPNGMAVAAPSPDEALFLYRQIFDQKEYSRFGVRLGDGAVVVDVGANIGLFSLWASRQARDVRLVAVEPNPDAVPYLRANLGLYAPAADLVEAAVTDRTGTAELTSFPQLTYLSGLGARRKAATDLVQSHHDQAGEAASEAERTALLADVRRRLDGVTHVVPTITLADLFRRLELDRVDLLKINAEGAELSILRGLGSEHWSRIAQVCLEVERASVVGPRIRAILAAAAFEVHETDDWNLGTGADVRYVYATRADAMPLPGRPTDGAADRLLTAGALREHLSSLLPDALLPEQIVFVERLPRLPNGKLARLELPAPPPRMPRHRTDSGQPVAGGSGAVLEDSLREVWRSELGVDGVHDDDNFLALGGHSLTALRVSVQVRETVGMEVSPASCLRASTFADWLGGVAGRPVGRVVTSVDDAATPVLDGR